MSRAFPLVVSGFALLLASPPIALAQSTDRDLPGVRRCLAAWKDHPFDAQSPKFRVIEPKVGVFGIGGDIKDDVATPAPELVYIRPAVSVMSKSDIDLLNPNGWYCIEKSVSVMAKIAIRLQCKAHLATTEEGVSVMGGGDRGVIVMGATRVEKVGCE
jgi:hypothetical protein